MSHTAHEAMHNRTQGMLQQLTAAADRCARANDLHAGRHDETYARFVLEELAQMGEQIAVTQRWLSAYAVGEFGTSVRSLAKIQGVGHTTVARWVRETSLDDAHALPDEGER